MCRRTCLFYIKGLIKDEICVQAIYLITFSSCIHKNLGQLTDAALQIYTQSITYHLFYYIFSLPLNIPSNKLDYEYQMLRSSCFYTAESETAIIADYNLNKRHRKYLVRNIFLFFFSHFHLRGVIAFRHFENIMNILKDMWEKVEYIFLESKQMFSSLSSKT